MKDVFNSAVATPPSPQPQWRAGAKPKILIVDDDVAITRQLFWALCDDFEVMTANDLQSAVRRATIYEPEISILDLHLPPALHTTEVGLRVLEYIKGRQPASRVVVVSSAADAEARRACAQRGADAVIDKPLDVEHLLAEVRRLRTGARLAAS